MRAAGITAGSDETGLITRVRAGDREAFVALMRRYNGRVFRIARSVLTDDAEAEDAAQEAWVLAFRHLGQFEGRSGFGSWLARIAVREAVARAKRRRLVLVGDIEEEGMADSSRDPERMASDAEARILLERAVDALPEAFRTVFVMRSVEEMSVAETADCLGIPEDTVKTRLHRARRMLREDLAQQLGDATHEVFSFAGERCDRIIASVLRRIGDDARG